ncbi:DUF2807 domain-containing protein [Flavobacterium magnum]|uniref:DUF2807 domain-containing protein n=1 Tax=Flavobacterium magnum TaxID=2162713 RepID=A0A2S0RGA1_9FLAO|nr:head GIN domain-containing protein [Flavobacterium magnum]AWA30686.1 DUF2807 domain-containing protein [Flavobacterium magnum]
MKNAVRVLCIAMCSMLAHAQEKRNPGHFTGIDVRGSFNVVLSKGKEGVAIYADKSALEHIKTEVSNGVLALFVEGTHRIKGNVKIEVSYETLAQIILNGSGDITTEGTINTEDLKVQLIGSGDIALTVEARNVKASLDGSGDITLQGKATNLSAGVTGSGNLLAGRLKSGNVQAAVVGSGDCTVFASEAIRARVEGSGDISYYGNPATEDTKVSGSGSIDKK